MSFIIWLSPADYGYWASASAALFIVAGMVNFGEVNGYLATGRSDIAETRRSIFRINLLLVCAGLAVATLYALGGDTYVSFLICLLALGLPLSGEANLLYAEAVRQRKHTTLVRAQIGASVTRLAIGLAVAFSTGSALAFVASVTTYSAVLVVYLRCFLHYAPRSPGLAVNRTSRRRRVTWGVQSLSQTLPTQADYFVVSLISGSTLLGLYYFAYQVTVGISALIVAPLSRTALAEMSGEVDDARAETAERLVIGVTAIVALAACLGAACVFLGIGLFPPRWQAAGPVIVILLASLPSRFMAPLTDALQMSRGDWSRSTALNCADAVGTAAVSVSALWGSVTLLACSIVSWKVIYSSVRAFVAFRDTGRGRRLLFMWPAICQVVFVVLAGLVWDWRTLVLIATSAGIGLFQLRNRSKRSMSPLDNVAPARQGADK